MEVIVDRTLLINFCDRIFFFLIKRIENRHWRLNWQNRTSRILAGRAIRLCFFFCFRFLAYSLPACIGSVKYFLFYYLLNAYDDSVSGVCCSTAVPARGGNILTRNGVRLGILFCTYIYIYNIYTYTYNIMHYIHIYIYIILWMYILRAHMSTDLIAACVAALKA